MSDVEKLKIAAKGVSLLYVEDNESLRKNASKLFQKFFTHFYAAQDGKEGLELFKKHHPQIVVTDIRMPNMDGLTLTKHIKHMRADTKVIFMTAHDDKEYLYKSIELGVFRLLKKPVNLSALTKTLYEALVQIRHESQMKLFHIQLKSIFNYQSAMVVMIKDETPVIANQVFLDFFGVETVEEFTKNYQDIGALCMEHEGFLYTQATDSCFDQLKKDFDKIYHVKMKNTKGDIRHLILKMQKVPEKKDHFIASFDDVTELNLLKLFDERTTHQDKHLQDTEAMIKLLNVLQRNTAKIHLYNFYKGLSITNDAIITNIIDTTVTVKTNYVQQKAIQFEKKSLIVSDALPFPISCDKVLNLSFEKQSIEFEGLHFVTTSPTSRKTIRVNPPQEHTVSLFLEENKFQGDVYIEDISLDAVKLKLNALPAGLIEGTEVIIDMVLEVDKRPLIINTKATMLKKREGRHSFSVVFMFELKPQTKSNLVKYITKRQMAIIREFKGLQNG